MKDESPLCLEGVMFSVILLLLVGTLNAKPIDYKDVANLLPTEPQTTNDTLAVIVQDPVIQDAVQDAVGNNKSLGGLVVKKKVLVMPAIEPTKVVSQREQILVVPMTHLEDVRKNITETVNAETDVDGLALTDIQFLTEDGEDEYVNSQDEDNQSYAPQHDDIYEALTEISKTMRKPTFPIDNIPQEIPYFVSDPNQETILPDNPTSAITVPIIAFLDSAKISDDKINLPIAAAIPRRDDTLKSQLNLLENTREDIQRNVQNYVDRNSWSTDPDNWQFTSSPSEIEILSSLYNPVSTETRKVRSENSLPVVVPRIDIVTPLVWTSDADINYPKHPHDMDVAADIVFRPLFRYQQEAQQRSYRRSTYRRRNSYNSYPRRNYGYRQRYSNDYYY